MSISFTKLATIAGTVLLLTLSTNSFASGLYGNVGYGHHPIHIAIGYNGHGKHYSHRRDHYKHYNKRSYGHQRRHYNKHAYNYRHSNRHHYNQPRKYCRSGY